jgi:hypothetical protein
MDGDLPIDRQPVHAGERPDREGATVNFIFVLVVVNHFLVVEQEEDLLVG